MTKAEAINTFDEITVFLDNLGESEMAGKLSAAAQALLPKQGRETAGGAA
jgi:hypothetical protein